MTFNRHSARRTARILCIAAAFSLLVGCTPSSPSSTNRASMSGALNQPDTSSVLILDGEENGLPDAALTALNEALDHCLGWGPGTAGSSLHSVVAAAALLDWATDNELTSRSAGLTAEAFASWYDQLDDLDRDTFSETWPLVCDDADALLEAPESMAERMESAGVDPARAADWDAMDWVVLRSEVEGGGGC